MSWPISSMGLPGESSGYPIGRIRSTETAVPRGSRKKPFRGARLVEHLRPAGAGRVARPRTATTGPGSLSRCCEPTRGPSRATRSWSWSLPARSRSSRSVGSSTSATGPAAARARHLDRADAPDGRRPDVRYYQQARKVFGSDETLLLVVRRPEGILDPDAARDAVAAHEAARAGRGRGPACSRWRTRRTCAAPTASCVVAPLYRDPPRDAAELARIRHDLIEQSAAAQAALFSEDETTTALVIPLLDLPEQQFTR